MKLDVYMKKENISALRLADDLKCHYQTIYNYLRNGRKPSTQLAKKIIDYTKGEVTLDDLLEGIEEHICPQCNQKIRIKKDVVE